MTESEAPGVMPTAHRRGASVVAVFTREVAETKARQGNDAGQSTGYPLTFTTEREDWESRENAIPGRWLAIFGHVPRVQACRCMAHAYNFQEIGARREPAIC
ncbi:ATP-dependent Clp protease adaptor ClpS [Mameliella sp. CS4]|nr:ATP-dependent Clp protease adaptor ClpS [Mameliella sp. CS4]